MIQRVKGPVNISFWLALAALIWVLDQLSKWLIIDQHELGWSQAFSSFFNLVRVHNTGAAFSFLAQADGWQRWLFTGLGIAAAALIVWMLHRHAHQRLFSFALSMILAGALGNVTDRICHGYVIDFLDFHFDWLMPMFFNGHFPAFNLADSAITLGAACLILDEWLRVRRSR
jgi:signal peptidase II